MRHGRFQKDFERERRKRKFTKNRKKSNNLVFYKITIIAMFAAHCRGEAFVRLGINTFMTIYGKCFAPIFSKNQIITKKRYLYFAVIK
ncbi:hypothetical protein KsCSTR_37260 [Candidatus Kuenenia stuttgartiensis]|uniref:Uncharacterized protein n=1 Tax=Kuenenia stuttgartiensis TaxID=174633 RepID=Q1Q687_KUEST|nr:hypothetical protein KsCSTR_37260 [Candidatus Kuenenia stuttgartiensis]CAJ73094.1 unknown protein [Candidatus Kuenenia stuttgartiensis]SOH05805.1 hypothetical protein KSMBR1_3329 [Candidatus Kuenenia stuttgartiensis]